MSAWGHHLETVAPDEKASHHFMSGGYTIAEMTCTNGLRCPGMHVVETQSFGTSRVGGTVTHRATYRYITGRAGRVGERELFLCDSCAAKFATRHKLIPNAEGSAPPPNED
jgi:hypothetical protein